MSDDTPEHVLASGVTEKGRALYAMYEKRFGRKPAADTACRFCDSTRCFTRVLTRDRSFDEIACNDHLKELKALADSAPGRKLVCQSLGAPLGKDDSLDGMFEEVNDLGECDGE